MKSMAAFDVSWSTVSMRFGQRTGILDGLLADLAEARIDGRIVDIGRLGTQHPARAEFLTERGVLGIVLVLRLRRSTQISAC